MLGVRSGERGVGRVVSGCFEERKLVGCVGLAGGNKTVRLGDESVERRGEEIGSRAWG
jgi:hypothetical protein